MTDSSHSYGYRGFPSRDAWIDRDHKAAMEAKVDAMIDAGLIKPVKIYGPVDLTNKIKEAAE